MDGAAASDADAGTTSAAPAATDHGGAHGSAGDASAPASQATADAEMVDAENEAQAAVASDEGSGDGEAEKLAKEMEVMARTVFVGGLPPETRSSVLKARFAECGKVHSCKIKVNEHGSARGFAFVTYMDKENAEQAKAKLDGMEFEGRILNVGPARHKKGNEPRSASSARRRGRSPSAERRRHRSRSRDRDGINLYGRRYAQLEDKDRVTISEACVPTFMDNIAELRRLSGAYIELAGGERMDGMRPVLLTGPRETLEVAKSLIYTRVTAMGGVMLAAPPGHGREYPREPSGSRWSPPGDRRHREPWDHDGPFRDGRPRWSPGGDGRRRFHSHSREGGGGGGGGGRGYRGPPRGRGHRHRQQGPGDAVVPPLCGGLDAPWSVDDAGTLWMKKEDEQHNMGVIRRVNEWKGTLISIANTEDVRWNLDTERYHYPEKDSKEWANMALTREVKEGKALMRALRKIVKMTKDRDKGAPDATKAAHVSPLVPVLTPLGLPSRPLAAPRRAHPLEGPHYPAPPAPPIDPPSSRYAPRVLVSVINGQEIEARRDPDAFDRPLPSYLEVRDQMNLWHVRNLHQLIPDGYPELRRRVLDIYGGVEGVDAYMGGLLEARCPALFVERPGLPPVMY